MTYTHTPKYIYVIIGEQFVITNPSGRTYVRTLHVDCVWTVVSDSPSLPAHGHGAHSLQSQRALSLFRRRSHSVHGLDLVLYSFPIMRRCCLCLLNLPCWWHIKIMFVPTLAVSKRKQRDRVNLAPSLVRMKTKAYPAQNSISIVRKRT